MEQHNLQNSDNVMTYATLCFYEWYEEHQTLFSPLYQEL
jgi:hypothetical protein